MRGERIAVGLHVLMRFKMKLSLENYVISRLSKIKLKIPNLHFSKRKGHCAFVSVKCRKVHRNEQNNLSEHIYDIERIDWFTFNIHGFEERLSDLS